jgi:hypothetical protein
MEHSFISFFLEVQMVCRISVGDLPLTISGRFLGLVLHHQNKAVTPPQLLLFAVAKRIDKRYRRFKGVVLMRKEALQRFVSILNDRLTGQEASLATMEANPIHKDENINDLLKAIPQAHINELEFVIEQLKEIIDIN